MIPGPHDIQRVATTVVLELVFAAVALCALGRHLWPK